MAEQAKSSFSSKAALLLGLAFAGLSVGTVIWLALAKAATQPQINDQKESRADAPENDSVIDWDYLWSINTNIVGWISISGTDISYPIARAPQDNPTFYLSHDVWGNWNPYGCPYISAESSLNCSEWSSCIIFGHNMDDGSMFAPLTSYSNASWARDHAEVRIQTPSDDLFLQVNFVRIVDAETETQPIGTLSQAEFSEWYLKQIESADVLIRRPRENFSITLCTCSYGTFESQRTLVYLS